MHASSGRGRERPSPAAAGLTGSSRGLNQRSPPATCGHCELPAKRRLWQLQLRARVRDVELDDAQTHGAASAPPRRSRALRHLYPKRPHALPSRAQPFTFVATRPLLAPDGCHDPLQVEYEPDENEPLWNELNKAALVQLQTPCPTSPLPSGESAVSSSTGRPGQPEE
ncbi:hypothetical protein MTO96_026826 [Rhipicephalus appendiculatus]